MSNGQWWADLVRRCCIFFGVGYALGSAYIWWLG